MSSSLAWDFYKQRAFPALGYARLLHDALPEAEACCAVAMAETVGLWQLTGKALTNPPSLLTINTRPEGADAIGSVLRLNRGFTDVRPLRHFFEEARESYPAACRCRMKTVAEARATAAASGPRELERFDRQFSWLWDQAKPFLIGRGRLLRYAEAFDPVLGLLTDDSEEAVLLLDRPEDRAQFLHDIVHTPARLLEPTGHGSDLTIVPKVAPVSGNLRPEEWDAAVVDPVVIHGLPVLFLPYSSESSLATVREKLDLMMIADGMTGTFVGTTGNRIVPPLSIAQLEPGETYERIIRARLRHMPGGYEFFVLRTLRELGPVCHTIVRFLQESDLPQPQADLLVIDFHHTCLRALAAGIESLAFHGWGFDHGLPKAQLNKLLAVIREGNTTFRKLQRRLQKRKAAELQRVIGILVGQGLVTVVGTEIHPVPLDSFIRAIPQRAGFPEHKLFSSDWLEALKQVGV